MSKKANHEGLEGLSGLVIIFLLALFVLVLFSGEFDCQTAKASPDAHIQQGADSGANRFSFLK